MTLQPVVDLRDALSAQGDNETADALAALLTFAQEAAALLTEDESNRASEDAVAELNNLITKARELLR